jgi:hypothetical protein
VTHAPCRHVVSAAQPELHFGSHPHAPQPLQYIV